MWSPKCYSISGQFPRPESPGIQVMDSGFEAIRIGWLKLLVLFFCGDYGVPKTKLTGWRSDHLFTSAGADARPCVTRD